MKQTTALVGPRGWAALVLAGGAALAAPFLRSSHTPDSPTVTSDAPHPDFSPNAWPDVHEHHLAPAAGQAADLSEVDWQELAKLQTVSAQPRKVLGKLPSTNPDQLATALPSWADHGRRVDQVVDAAARGEPLEQNPSLSRAEIQPLRPWVSPSVRHEEGPNSTASLANTLPTTSPDPFAGWTSSTTAAHALASQQPIKPYEDRPQQWPDQKLKIDDLPNLARTGLSAIVQNKQSTAPDNFRQSMELPSLARAAGAEPASIPTPLEPAGPRVGLSSASMRESMTAAPTTSPPTSPPPSQASPAISQPPPAPARQRQFIHQPSKRA